MTSTSITDLAHIPNIPPYILHKTLLSYADARQAIPYRILLPILVRTPLGANERSGLIRAMADAAETLKRQGDRDGCEAYVIAAKFLQGFRAQATSPGRLLETDEQNHFAAGDICVGVFGNPALSSNRPGDEDGMLVYVSGQPGHLLFASEPYGAIGWGIEAFTDLVKVGRYALPAPASVPVPAAPVEAEPEPLANDDTNVVRFPGR